MTPFDVLQSAFGNSLSPGELDDALGRNGWDFESTMEYWVVVSSSNSADKSSEETGRYLHPLHHKDSTFAVATMPPMQPDLGVEAPCQSTMDME